MKLFQMLSVVLMLLGSGSAYAQICIANNCTDANSVGSMEVRQHNGLTECFGPGCADLGISMPGHRYNSGGDSLYPSIRFEGGFEELVPNYLSAEYQAPIIRKEIKCKPYSENTPAMMRECRIEVWYRINDADLLSVVSARSGCSDEEIIRSVKSARRGQREALICTRQR